MTRASIILLSSVAIVQGALGACSSDDTTGSPTGSTSASTTGGSAGSTSMTSSTSTTSAGGGGGSSSTSGSAGQGGTGGATGGGAGTGGTAGTGGSGQDAGVRDGEGGTPATAVASIMPFMTGTITGTATFTASGAGVTIVVALQNCPAGVHPLHIHAGTGCGSEQEQGLHWDPPRGENIGPSGTITCAANQTGTLTYTRAGTDPTPWTIGPPTASNVIGHPIVIHGVGATSTVRDGCGVIMLQ
jgi:Cu/Zn superoxide dismutase